MSLMPRKLLVQQGTTGAPVKTPAEDWRLANGALWTPDPTDGFKERTGVVASAASPGASRALDVLVAGGTAAVTVYPGRFVLMGSNPYQGSYVGAVDAQTVRAIPGASWPASGQFKAGYVIVHVYDQVYGDSQDGFDLEFVLGAAASTAGAAVPPALPTNSFYLRDFTVNSAGAITLGNNSAQFTVARGGIYPSISSEATIGAWAGAYRDAIDAGLQRWVPGAFWDPVVQKLPSMRVYRTGSTNYSPVFTNIPYDAVDSGYTYNPGNAFFTFVQSGRRVVCTKAGLYHVQMEAVGTGTLSQTRIGLMTGDNVMGTPIVSTTASSCSGLVRLAGGESIGGAMIQTANDAADGSNGYHNHLVITRIGV